MKAKKSVSKAYYEKNREKLNARSKAYFKKNRVKILAKAKAKRANDPEKYRAQSKAYYAKNREKMNAEKNARRAKDPEKHRAYDLPFVMPYDDPATKDAMENYVLRANGGCDTERAFDARVALRRCK